jgi:predicted transcriptional regulator
LSNQANQLKQLVQRFKIKNDSYMNYTQTDYSQKMLQSENRAKLDNPNDVEDFNLDDNDPEDFIKLDEDDFGKF